MQLSSLAELKNHLGLLLLYQMECCPTKRLQCTYFNKSLNENWFVALHQDRSIPVSHRVSAHYTRRSLKEGITFIHGPDEVLAQMIALRLHPDDSTLDNGPLRVLPGSHGYGTLSQSQIQGLRHTNDI